MIRLVTYNIHFGKRLIDIISWIDTQKTADIICFQEFPALHLTTFFRALPRTWGHRFTQSFIYRRKKFVLVTLFRHKKLRLLKNSTLLMGVHRMEKSLLKNPMQKSCLITTFQKGSKTITVANTHLVFLAANRSRYRQVHMITDRLKSLRHALVITGDFNIPNIRAKHTLLSFMQSVGYQTIVKRMSSYRVAILKYQLDYVFVKYCTLTSLALERVRYSDHYPVMATVHL